jgi:predicted nucleic acid-binding protein
MSGAGESAFFDTNVLLYLLSKDEAKADRSEELLAAGGVVSVQVLNEFASVASRKAAMSWADIREVLSQVRLLCSVEPISLGTHDRALLVAGRYGLSLYDSVIVAAALLAGCTTLYSEDLQHGQLIDRQLTLRNPFAGFDRP